MINNKGKKFAKDYWTMVVVQEASNYISLGESYGKKVIITGNTLHLRKAGQIIENGTCV